VGTVQANDSASAESAAKGYSVQGATLGISLSEFQRSVPSARKVTTDDSAHTIKYEMDTSAAAVTEFNFVQGRLTTISTIYTFEGHDRVESENAVAEQLRMVFGRPDRSDDALLGWSFPRVQRAITCAPSQSNFVVRVSETSVSR
jgi:hypothetical protein